MSLENHIVLNISKSTSAPSALGFGKPGILSLEANLLGSFAAVRLKEYDIATVLTDLVADGFTIASQTYKSAEAMTKQSPRVSKIKVIKRAVSVVQVDTNTIDNIVNDNTYTTTINGVPHTFLSDADATDIEIRDGILASIAAGIQPVAGAIDGDNSYTITADNAGEGFSNAVDADQSVVNDTANVGPVSELIAAQDEDDDFYCLLMDVYTKLDILLLASYIESQVKIFGYQTDEGDSKDLQAATDVTSLMALLKAKNYTRTFGEHVPTADLSEHKHAAIVGKQLSKNPGSTNWAYQTVNGVTADSFTAAEAKNIKDKNGNTYTTVAAIDIFFEGKMSSGEFIDITRGIDWITARIKESVFGLFTSVEKVPYDDGGLESIGAAILVILNGNDGAEKRLILVAGSSSVEVPTRDESSTTDRSNRVARNFKFKGELVGAVNTLFLDGTLTI